MSINVTIDTRPHDLNPKLTRVLIVTDHPQGRMSSIASASIDIAAVVATGSYLLEFYMLREEIQAALVRIVRAIHQDRRQGAFSRKIATVALNGTTYAYPEFVQAMGSSLTTREQSEHPAYR